MANREQVEALQRKISPFMLRRVKEDVAKDIPAKEETVIDVELTSIQKQYYRAIFEQNHAFLSMGAGKAGAPSMMNIQMELRKCCELLSFQRTMRHVFDRLTDGFSPQATILFSWMESNPERWRKGTKTCMPRASWTASRRRSNIVSLMSMVTSCRAERWFC